MQMSTRWEDEENNRTIHLHIDTQVDSSAPAITPVRVDFTAQNRSIGVWTEAGKNFLRRQLEFSGQLDEILNQACAAIA